MNNCCKLHIKNTKKNSKCLRNDGKIFNLPRKFSFNQCKNIKGFTMKASCSPYKYCFKNTKKNGGKKIKKEFLYNPNNLKKSFDVYINKNPSDTINIKYSNLNDIKQTIKKLEKLYKTKKYPHKRIWQVGMIMKVRMQAMLKHKKTLYKKAKYVKERYNLTKKYFEFLGKRSKVKTFKLRKTMKFNF